MSEAYEDSYADIVPHLIMNTPAIFKINPCSWTALRSQLSNLRNHSAFCAENFCDVEVCLDPIDATTMNEGCSKERLSMSFEKFFNHTIDMRRDDMYLKDWHIDRAKGLEFEYSVPEAFRDDWLNWYWKSCRGGVDDYSFLYIGGKDTFTALHHDVCCSNSWSFNLFGRKKWTLWAPSELHKLALHYTTNNTLDSRGTVSADLTKNEIIHDDSDALKIDCDINRNNNGCVVHTSTDFVKDARDGCCDKERYPGVSIAKQTVFYQGVDDVIFVPSGWYHQVENIAAASTAPATPATPATPAAASASPAAAPATTTDIVIHKENSIRKEKNPLENMTVSLNRNWFNGFSVREVWLYLTREFAAARKELEHIKPHKSAFTLESNSNSNSNCNSNSNSNCNSNSNSNSRPSGDSGKMASNKSNSLYSDYTPPMEFIEWHLEVDKLIRANAALNIKEFVEIISARVMMMENCRIYVKDLPLTNCHMVDDPSYKCTRPCAQDSRSKDCLLTWSALFCPRYEQCVTDEDVEVDHLLCTSLLPLEYDITRYRLSSYLPSSVIPSVIHDTINRDKGLSEINVPEGLNNMRVKETGANMGENEANKREKEKETNVVAQCSAMEHTCSEVHSIINDMLSSDDFLIHLTCCLQSELQVLVGNEQTAPFDATSSIQVIKSNLQGLLCSISKLKYNATQCYATQCDTVM